MGNPYFNPRIKLGGLVEVTDTLKRCRRVMFVACGTSYHAALAARQTVEEMCKVRACACVVCCMCFLWCTCMLLVW